MSKIIFYLTATSHHILNTMENLFLFLATSLVLRNGSRRFKRYSICSGCSSLLHSGSKLLHVRQAKDGDTLYFNEYMSDGVTYGMICVQMQEEYTLHQAESILVHYINRVRKPLRILFNTSMEIERTNRLLSITDYWQDQRGMDWKIKGQTNGRVLSLLYVKNITEAPVNVHDAFLNGFRFSFVQ